MVKKIISIALCVMLLSGYSVFAEPSCSFDEDFSNTTISLTDNYRISGDVSIVNDAASSNNYLSIGENSYFQKLYTSPVSSGVYLKFSIRAKDSNNGYLFLKGGLGSGKNIIEIRDNSIYANNVSIAQLSDTGWSTVELEISNSAVNIYVDNDLKSNDSGISNVQLIRFGNSKGKLFIDNVSAEDGKKPQPETFSDEKVTTYYSQGFNDATDKAGGTTVLQDTKDVSFQNNKGLNGKGLCFQTENTGKKQEPLVQFDSKFSDKAVCSFHLKMGDFNSLALLGMTKGTGGSGMGLGAVDTTGKLCAITNGWNRIPEQQLKVGKWYRIQFVIDFVKQTFDIYLDYKQVAKDVAFGYSNVTDITNLRFSLQDSNGVGSKMYMDNITVYSGSNIHVAPRLEQELNNVAASQDAVDETPVVSTANKGRNPIGAGYENQLATRMNAYNAIGLMVGELGAYKKTQKITFSSAPEVVNDRTYIPLRGVSEAFDLNVAWDESSKTATVKNDTVALAFAEGKNTYSINGSSKPMDTVPYSKKGSLMVPLRVLAETLNKKVTYDEPGLIIIGDTENFLTRAKDMFVVNELIQTIVFDRPSRKDILNDIAAKGGIQHPSILGKRDKYEFCVQQYKDGVNPYKKWGDAVIKTADALLTTKPIKKSDYTASNAFLDASRKVGNVVENCSMAYWLTKDEKYAKRISDEVNAAINFPTWEPDHFLNIGEMTFAIALAYDSLYDYWTDEQRTAIKKAIVDLGLNEGLKNYHDSGAVKDWNVKGFWVVLNSNWNLVCNGGLIPGALMVADDAKYVDVAGEVLESAIRGEEYGLMNVFPDGGWDEGPGYWDFGMKYFTTGMSAIENCTGKDYGLKNSPALDKTGYFPFRLFGAREDNNFHDAGAGGKISAQAAEISWLANWYGDEQLNSLRYDSMMRYGYGGARDILWHNPNLYKAGESISLDGYARNVETGSFRNMWNNDEATALLFHAGDVNAGHGHQDVGNFLFDTDGQRWAFDLGADNYDLPGYFNDNQRYNYYRTRAEGHNTIVLNPSANGGQVLGKKAIVTDFATKPRGGYAVVDLTDAYADAKSYKRGYLFTNDRNVAIIQDELTTKKPSELYWFMHTMAEVQIAADGKSAILTLGGKSIRAEILSPDGTFQVTSATPLSTSPNEEMQNKNDGIRKLVIHLSNVEQTTISVALFSIEDGKDFKPEYKAISDWSIPDGDIKKLTLDNIFVDDKPLEGFAPEVYNYTVTNNFDYNGIPKTSAESDKYDVTIENVETVPGYARIILKDKDDHSIQNVYTIMFNRETIAGVIDKPKLEIKSVTASAEPQPQNPKEHSIDGDLNTVWAAEGNQWIAYDLGDVKTVSAISIAFMKSNTRIAKFKLQASTDGENWTDIFDTQSAGNINGYETFGMSPTSARYIRIYGRGNTENRWNSISEVIIYGE